MAAAQTAGTITLSATNNNGDRDPDTPGLQVDEGDIVTFTYTGNSLTELVGVDTVTTGTADSGIDYERILFPGTGLSVQRIFTPSNPGTSILVRVVNDSVAEDDETVIATLSNPVGFDTAPSTTTTIGTPGSVTITIRANDGSVASLGGADADAPGGGTVNVPVEFSSSPARTADSTVAFAIAGTATATDYTVTTGSAITFDATAATGTIAVAQADTSGAIPITIASGATAGRTLIVTLTGHSGGGVGSVVSSAARTYTLTESTPAPVAGVTLSATTLAVGEGDNGAYSVALTTEPGGAVVITPSVLPGGHDLTLTRGGVALLPSGALTFTAANWNSAQTVSVAAGEDADTTDDTATISHAVSGYGSVTAGAVVVTVSDDDAADSAPAFDAAEEIDATNAVILPEVARVMVGNHVSTITNRINQARTPTGRAGAGLRANLGGHSTLEALAATHAQTMVDGGLDTKTLLGDSDFAMPLNADGGGLGGANLALWGSGDYRNIGGDSNNVDWDGSLFSAHLGVDVALQPGLLAGVMLAWSEADLEYTNNRTATATTGDYELDMTSLHPYVGWRALNGRLDLWTTVGYGSGDLKITETNAAPTTADATLQTLGAGGSARLLASRDTELRVKGEVQATRLEVEQAADDAFNEMEVSATQTRLALEATRTVTTRSGAQVSPSLELGMRYDGGDGATGNGVEIGGGFRFQSAGHGLTLETRARALLAHSGETEDIGISATLKLTPGADGQGLSLSLAPAYGNTGGGAEEVWRGGLSADTDPQASLNARVGYGLPAAAFMLTPYGEMALGEDVQNYRLGLSWGVGALFDLNLVGEREEKDGVGAEHAIWFEGDVRF